jgi:hypothetical protein
MLRNENFILKMLSLFKIDRTRQHHVCAEQSSPSWIAFVLKRHSLEFSFSIETYFVITLFLSAEAWQL